MYSLHMLITIVIDWVLWKLTNATQGKCLKTLRTIHTGSHDNNLVWWKIEISYPIRERSRIQIKWQKDNAHESQFSVKVMYISVVNRWCCYWRGCEFWWGSMKTKNGRTESDVSSIIYKKKLLTLGLNWARLFLKTFNYLYWKPRKSLWHHYQDHEDHQMKCNFPELDIDFRF